MSQTVDTNVLVYASHTGSPFHERARALVVHLVAGPSLAYFLWPAVLGVPANRHPSSDPRNAAVDRRGNLQCRSRARAVTRSASSARATTSGRSFRRVAADVKPRGQPRPRRAPRRAHAGTRACRRSGAMTGDLRKFSGITVKDPFSELPSIRQVSNNRTPPVRPRGSRAPRDLRMLGEHEAKSHGPARRGDRLEGTGPGGAAVDLDQQARRPGDRQVGGRGRRVPSGPRSSLWRT